MMLGAREISLADRLHAVSTDFRPGEITAICGPNGAGKSTLLSVLAGLERPDGGVVELDGRTLAAMTPRERARSIGYLPQEPTISWDVAVRHCVALGRLPHGDRGTGAVAAAMRSLDIVNFADRPASQLSGGERARVLLARVFAGEPRWILADEPLAALDLAHQLNLIGHLRRKAQSGVGIVVVLHDLGLAMNHADRVLVLDRGRLVAAGPSASTLVSGLIADVWGVAGSWVSDANGYAFIAHWHDAQPV